MTTTPARPFRIIRGAAANYKTSDYTTKERRDAAARRFAEQDGESVLTELWSADHPQDGLSRGWACDGQVYPPDAAPEPAAAGVRGPASLIRPGDTVTVFALRGPYGESRDYTGEVFEVEPGPPHFGMATIVITLTPTDEVRHIVVTVVETAVTVWHEFHVATQCGCAEFEQDDAGDYVHNCCNSCGRAIFDGGTDGWQHAEVWDLTPAPGTATDDEDTDADPDAEQAYGEVVTPTGAEVHVTGYWHQPLDGSPGYVVLDVDTPESDDADPTPLHIVVNDGTVYEQGGRPLPAAHVPAAPDADALHTAAILARPTTAADFIKWVTGIVESEAEFTEHAHGDGGNDGTVADFLADLATVCTRAAAGDVTLSWGPGERG